MIKFAKVAINDILFILFQEVKLTMFIVHLYLRFLNHCLVSNIPI